MNVNRKFLAGICGVLLSLGLAHGQQPYVPPPPLPTAPVPQPEEPNSLPQVLSNWVTYRDKGPPPVEANAPCSSPIGSELFLRNGVSAPFGSGVFPAVLSPGWIIEGGARGLLYNEARTGAWVLEASISNIYNYAHPNGPTVPFTNIIQEIGGAGTLIPGVTNAKIHNLNRTFVNVGLGYDWYVWKPKRNCKEAHCDDGLFSNATWSIGLDGGGRYGSARVEFEEMPPPGPGQVIDAHRTGVVTGAYAALHSDLQIPLACHFILDFGWRVEWGYTHSNVLVQSSNAIQDANFLINCGVRY